MARIKKVQKAQKGMYLTESGDTLRGKEAAAARRREAYMTEGLEEMKQQRLKTSPKTTPKKMGKIAGGPSVYTMPNAKKGGMIVKKAKKGGSFPDLNKDGKVTKKDILIGKGVLPKTAKKGTALKKQAATAIAMKKAGKTPKTMKRGGSMKNCRGGCY